MLSRATCIIAAVVVALSFVGRATDAHAASFSSWVDANYDFEVYWGTPETVYDLYVVYANGREGLYHTYTSSASLSAQMRDFAEGRHPTGVVDWYYVQGQDVVTWNYYRTYGTRALAESNADWIEAMGLETEIRKIYNPSYKRK